MSFVLVDVLLEPQQIADLDPSQYQQLVSQGRSSGLLGSLHYSLQQAGLLDEVPYPVRRHLDSAWFVYTKIKQDITYEVAWLQKALTTAGERLVLLKGAAYSQADLPLSFGRTLSDIDIITPAHRIRDVENALNEFGWQSSALDSYNERYYRKWMHEIPPMGHKRRSSFLDLHHTILPPTAAPNVDASLLLKELVEVKPGVFTLSPRDMVIHSATHLFHEGEFHHGLRDLWDLDRMLRDFPARDPLFWDGLVSRARELDLLGSLFHSLNYSQQIFATPVPPSVMKQAGSWSRVLRKPVMDFLFLRALKPDQPECKLPFTSLALYVLYIRSHYLRMPLYLLLPHLARKAWMSRFGGENQAPGEEMKENEAA